MGWLATHHEWSFASVEALVIVQVASIAITASLYSVKTTRFQFKSQGIKFSWRTCPQTSISRVCVPHTMQTRPSLCQTPNTLMLYESPNQ